MDIVSKSIQTDRLLLRAPLQRDLTAMHRVYADPQAMRYWSTPPHESLSQTEDLLRRRIAGWQDSPRMFQITVDHTYIGHVGNFRQNEIGYMLSPRYWRQGILTEALEAIIPFLWQTTPHQELFADVDPDNAASCALLRKFNFCESQRVEKTYCINGVWSDSIYFTLQRPPLEV